MKAPNPRPHLLFLLALGLSLAAAGLRADQSADLAQAARAWARGDLELALRDYSLAVDEGPASAAAFYGQAQCLQRLGSLREAAVSLARALRLDPGADPEGRLGRALGKQLQAEAGLALCRAADQDRGLGRLGPSARGYRLALQLDPECTQAWDGLAALAWQQGGWNKAWQASIQAGRADAAVPLGGLRAVAPGSEASRWAAMLKAGLQQGAGSSPWGGDVGTDGQLLGSIERRAKDWTAGYGYFLDLHRSSTGTAQVGYHAWSLVLAPAASVWSLQLDEAAEWSGDQLAYGHHLVELRRSTHLDPKWSGWSGARLLWENYPSAAELDAFEPSLALGLGGPLPWDGHLGLEIRVQGDDTQSWDARDGELRAQAVMVWRTGQDFSPRLDMDAGVQVFPDWPGSANRWDRGVDLRLELALWQDSHGQISVGDKVWRRASTVDGYSGLGNAVFAAGTTYW